jgi:AraC-like DNA-binding protein
MRRDDEKSPGDPRSEALRRLSLALLDVAPSEGRTQTIVPFLSVLRANAPTPVRQGLLRPSVCVVTQGHKRFHLGDASIEYGAGSYLAASIDVPASGQILGATASRPYLGAVIEIEAEEVAAVLVEAKLGPASTEQRTPAAAFVGETDAEAIEALLRLTKLLEHPRDAAFLAPGVKREILYRLLTGRSGHLFQQNVLFDRTSLGVGKAIQWLKGNFDQRIKVDDLARVAKMSVSSLQHKFKDVTAMGPLQYQKRLRLEEARRRLVGGADATSVAFGVGYESASQFSREYRRLFGLPPSRDVKVIRSKAKNTDAI